jgi:hypothetical protein
MHHCRNKCGYQIYEWSDQTGSIKKAQTEVNYWGEVDDLPHCFHTILASPDAHIIDHLFIEGPDVEFHLPLLFYKHGLLQRKQYNAVVCQLHITFSHQHIASSKIFHIVQQLLFNANFLALQIDWFPDHTTAYFLNVDAVECRLRYLTDCEQTNKLTIFHHLGNALLSLVW